MRRASALLCCALALRPAAAAAQGTPAVINGPPPPVGNASVTRDAQGRATLRAHRVTEPMRIDGALIEAIYSSVEPIGNFIQYEPNNGAPATEPTEVWVLYDNQNFYVCGKVYDDHPERWVLNEMRRDIPNVSANESIGFSIDTFNDKRNGFIFELNAIGGFLDGQITNEGFPPNTNWNTVWTGKAGRFDGGWSFEIAIPFRSIRYQPGTNQVWGFNVRRVVRWKNEESHIQPVPASLGTKRGLMQVSLSAPLVGLEVPSGAKNVELRPYGISSLTTDRVASPPLSNDASGNAGLDVKYGVTQNLTADLTLRTDFAQVEVDEQQVNLTRFSLVFPEKREFFLEGQGIFNFGGSEPVRHERRRCADAVLQPADRAEPWAGGRDPGRRAADRQGRRVHGRPAQHRDRRRCEGGRRGHQLQRGAPQARRAAPQRHRRALHAAVQVARRRRQQPDVRRGRHLQLLRQPEYQHLPGADRDTGPAGPRPQLPRPTQLRGDRYGFVAERLVIDEHFNPEVGFLRRPDLRKWAGTLRFSPRPRVIHAVRKYLYQFDGSYIEDNAGVVESKEWDGTFGLDLNNGDNLRVVGTQSFEFLARPFRIDPKATIPQATTTSRTSRSPTRWARSAGSPPH